MTITSLSPVTRYLGDGVQTVFPVAFPLFGDGRHLKAVIAAGGGHSPEERVLVYGIDYSVQIVSGGGECVTSAPVPEGHRLTLYLDLPYVQECDFDNQGRLDAEVLEKSLDYVTALAAQNAAILARTVKIPVSGDRLPEDLVSGIFTARDQALAAQKEARAYAEQAALGGIPAPTETVRGGIRVGEGLELADGDVLHVAVPLPPASPADAGKLLAVRPDGAAGWETMPLALAAVDAEPATGQPGLVFPDGETIRQTPEGMLRVDWEGMSLPPGTLEVIGGMPMPQMQAGIGQVCQVNGRVVPAGGTWLVWAFSTITVDSSGRFYPGGYSGNRMMIGVYAGGTTVPIDPGSSVGMLCWRIA